MADVKKNVAVFLGGVLMLVCGLTLFHDISVEQELRQDNVLLAEHITAKEKENTLLRAQVEALRKEALDAERRCTELEGEVEALTARFEDVTFGYDEVCEATGWNSLGEFRVTHYCNCEKCCGKWANGLTATGTVPTEGRTVAVDPSVIPLGTEIRLNGHVYVAEDTGVQGRSIDVFVNDHQEAIRLGLYRAEVERR